MHLNKNITLLSGDASFRKFYRKKKSIVVYADKEKNKNLLIYDAINKVLIKNKIKAPKLINENYANNYIEIEDLGKISMYDEIIKKNKKKLQIYKEIIFLINKFF